MKPNNIISSSSIDVEKLLKTTADLVQIQSINPPGLEEEVGKYLIEFFKKASIETKIFPVEKVRFNLVAKIPGKSSSLPLAFTGHMDVVPVSNKEFSRWKTAPFSGEIHDGFLYGRGSSDMKGGLASVMVAMLEIVKKNIVPAQDIYLIATVDEEDSMKGSKALLKENLLDTIPVVIVCEPTGLKLCTAGKGRTYGNIKIAGRTGHGSQGNGKNVIDFGRQLLNKMEEARFSHYENTPYGDSYWQALSIHAGVEPCVVPDELELKVDARLVPNHNTETIWSEMKNILADLKAQNPGYEVKIEVIDQREGWILPPESSVVSNIKEIYKHLNIPFGTTFFAGTTDGSIFRSKGMDCVILGPGDLNCVHKENERVSIQELIESCKIYFEIMRRFQ
jgi:acetylornithine deacetylase/succinyl-diaminopimelate desuccinylase family protein